MFITGIISPDRLAKLLFARQGCLQFPSQPACAVPSFPPQPSVDRLNAELQTAEPLKNFPPLSCRTLDQTLPCIHPLLCLSSVPAGFAESLAESQPPTVSHSHSVWTAVKSIRNQSIICKCCTFLNILIRISCGWNFAPPRCRTPSFPKKGSLSLKRASAR